MLQQIASMKSLIVSHRRSKLVIENSTIVVGELKQDALRLMMVVPCG
jgi:hypothetical protein